MGSKARYYKTQIWIQLLAHYVNHLSPWIEIDATSHTSNKFFWDDIRAMTGGRKANEPPCIMGSLSADLTSFHADSELILQMKSAFLVQKVTWSRVEIPDVKNIVDKIFDFARRAKPEGGSKSPDWSRHNDGAIINAIATFDPKQVRKCWNPSTFY